MTYWIEWLLGLEHVRIGKDAPLLLHWNTRVPAWVLFAVALLSAIWIVLIYRTERTTPVRRGLLALLRSGLIAIVIAMLCQPTLVLQRNRSEPSHVAILVDTSASMNLHETYADATIAEGAARGAGLENVFELTKHGRLDLVRRALLKDDAAPLRVLLKRNAVQPVTFASTADSQGWISSEAELGEWMTSFADLRADGAGTDLAAALAHVLDSGRGRRLAAIVLASDGQATQSTPLKDALDLAADRQVPIFPLRVGSTDPRLDVELGSLTAQDHVFINDVWVVEAKVTVRGLAESREIELRLVDAKSGETKARETVSLPPGESTVEVELKTRPVRTGIAVYRMEVSPLPLEATLENNSDQVSVVVLDNRVRVLFVDGYPRYEYRYVKNALLREPTVELSVLLLEADEEFVQEGTDPIRRFPETPEELNRYDVILFGDVDPRGGWITTAQMNMLVDFVGVNGGGFGLIAGERAAPHRYVDTPLEKLLPIRIDPTFLGHYEGTLVNGFHARLTSEGKRSRVFRMSSDRAESEAFFQSRPELFWIARTRGPKPGATPLAEHPTMATASGPMPLMVTGRYGAGKLYFQGTDDTWRWRRHTGEFFLDAYWVQVVRELMPLSKFAQGRRYVLRSDRRVYPYGAPVRAEVELFDRDLLAEPRETVDVLVRNCASDADKDDLVGALQADSVESDDPTVGGVSARVTLRRLSPESNVFEGSFVPMQAGVLSLECADMASRSQEEPRPTLIRVARADLELRRPEADYETLERIAAASGGKVLELDRLSDEFAAIKDRSVQVPDDVTEPLWDSRLVFGLFAGMISLEWTLRKVFGLL